MVTAALVAGCTQFPELEFTQTTDVEAAEYPALVPIEPIIAEADVPGPDPERLETGTNARLAALRARASRIRGEVLTGDEKKRLNASTR